MQLAFDQLMGRHQIGRPQDESIPADEITTMHRSTRCWDKILLRRANVSDMKKTFLRFSAMGDVALMVPVIRSLVAEQADVVMIVTRPRFAPFFAGIERVVVFDADVDQKLAGFFESGSFPALILKKNFDVIVDLHDHLRTVILRTF